MYNVHFKNCLKNHLKVTSRTSILRYISSSPEICYNKKLYTNVTNFYTGRSVLITGGTGFIGKALIEKLLYSCCDIDKIYVLIRETPLLNATQKLHQILENPAFSRLRRDRLTDLQKIVPIAGNIITPNLGISLKDAETLKEQVSVVVHSAATTKFNEPLREALQINFEGTRNVLQLCKEMKQIQSFVYLSTAYANTDKEIIDEKVYPPPAHVKDVYSCLEKSDMDENKMKKLLNGKFNTYIFTKALTESFIADEHGDVPTIIIRPSMVSPSILEPDKEWVDNMSVPSNLLLAGATGLNHVIRGKVSNIVDFVPVDYVVNLTIVAASTCKRGNELVVYNCCSGSTNPLYLGEVFKFFNLAALRFNNNHFPFPKVFIINSPLLGKIMTFWTQIIPATMFDFLLLLKGKKPSILKLQKKFIRMRDSQAYFTQNNWLFKSENVQELYKKISNQDQHIFCFNFYNIIWSEYMIAYAKAVRRLLIRQKNSRLK